jgi:hypothetical protein
MSTLCKTCSSVFAKGSAERYSSGRWYNGWNLPPDDIAERITWHPLHDSRQTLDSGIASGCELRSSVERIAPAGSSQFRTSFGMSYDETIYDDLLAIIDSTVSDRVPSFSSALLFYLKQCPSTNSSSAVQGAAVAASKSGHTRSVDTLHLARSWLQDCATRHEKCVAKSEPCWYPKRLLEISEDTVKLIDTANEDMQGHYFTLSYVWGDTNPPLMLTPGTERKLRNGLCIASLEKTYRDALVVTKAVGHKYLWIDLFCIFQDKSAEGKQDWKQESTTMDRVYAEGLLNISASHASHGNGGCFVQVTENLTTPPIRVFWAKTAGEHPTCYQIHSSYLAREQANVQGDFEETSPVFNRGWIVQERMLAPRVLHFAGEGIIWECCEGRAMQFSPYLPNHIIVSDRLGPCAGSLAAQNAPTTHLTSLWFKALYTYSRTRLTEPNKDKLIAMLGIRIAESLDDTLWRGFLSSTLPSSLCWYAACEPKMLREPCDALVNDKFPSWHFARSNHSLSSAHHSRALPLLRILYDWADLDRLYCIARVVPLQVELGVSCGRTHNTVHVLQLYGLTAQADGMRLSSSYCADEYCRHDDRVLPFAVHLDQPVYGPDSKLSWLFLPVCLHPRVEQPPNWTPEVEKDWVCNIRRITGVAGLLLQSRPNGETIRVGFVSVDHHREAELAVLLHAVRKAKPRFLMIS